MVELGSGGFFTFAENGVEDLGADDGKNGDDKSAEVVFDPWDLAEARSEADHYSDPEGYPECRKSKVAWECHSPDPGDERCERADKGDKRAEQHGEAPVFLEKSFGFGE